MAPSIPNQGFVPKGDESDSSVRRIPTAQDVTTTGGVWAPTSAKRDKLGELRVELEEGQESLDDAATSEQLLDLYLADGIRLIAQTTDQVPAILEESGAITTSTAPILDFSEWLLQQQKQFPEFCYNESQLVEQLTIVSDHIAKILTDLPPGRSLTQVRDFFDPSDTKPEDWATVSFDESSNELTLELTKQDKEFEHAVLRFRFLLAKAAVDHLLTSNSAWKILATLSDGDIDRAAVKGEPSAPQVVSIAKLFRYIFSHAADTCSARVDAAWSLLDRDNDGLLDESEMNNVVILCLAPVQVALQALMEEALDASPVRDHLPPLHNATNSSEHPQEQSKQRRPGWRQRRREAKVKKGLLKTFQNSVKNHFEDEVEIHHRLRCIYAWADKEHQGNKLDSVLVDEGWTGRKRYVELAPKISLAEFREVQQEHFRHLDRIGKEIVYSFREDLWVQQGRERQNRELMRDCLTFLTVVSIADYLILAS